MRIIKLMALALGLAAFLALAACSEEGPAEKAGKKIDETVEKAGEKVEEATDKVGGAVEEAGDKVQKSTDN